jgi:hypothetical protein
VDGAGRLPHAVCARHRPDIARGRRRRYCQTGIRYRRFPALVLQSCPSFPSEGTLHHLLIACRYIKLPTFFSGFAAMYVGLEVIFKIMASILQQEFGRTSVFIT